jgi:hypothetical protein
MLKGLPIAESELYKRRNTLLKLNALKRARRSNTLSTYTYIRKRNIDDNQSSVDYNERFRAPVFRELFSSSTISHCATRRRVLPLYKSEVAKEDQNTELA